MSSFDRRSLLAVLPIAASMFALAACEQAEEIPTVEDVREIAANAPDDCLVVVWDARSNAEEGYAPKTDETFDRERDLAEGGAISCATATSASQFEAAIQSIRDSVEKGDRAALLAEIGVPLLYIDDNGQAREMDTPEKLEEAFDEVFNDTTLEMLRRLELDKVTVVPNRGAYLDYGSIWLVVPETGARPRIVTINHQAAREAAELARRKAAEGDAGER